jgi:hypothetical protein
MLEFIYILFFWILVLEIVVFLFLNMPSPKGWKGPVIRFLTTNKTVKQLLKIHLGLCVVAAFFFWDLMNT